MLVQLNDDLDIDIENVKLKLTKTLRRKVQEMERLLEEISKLQKKDTIPRRVSKYVIILAFITHKVLHLRISNKN